MFNLNQASQSVRKAAAFKGIWSGKFEPIYDNQSDDSAIVVKVFNKNYPDGIEISAGEANHAINYTWQEIRQLAVL